MVRLGSKKSLLFSSLVGLSVCLFWPVTEIWGYVPNVFLELFEEKSANVVELRLLLSEQALPSKIVKSLTPLQATLLRNTIFALRGSSFRSPHYRAFFRQQKWYKATSSPDQIEFSELEKKNIASLLRQGADVSLFSRPPSRRPPRRASPPERRPRKPPPPPASDPPEPRPREETEPSGENGASEPQPRRETGDPEENGASEPRPREEAEPSEGRGSREGGRQTTPEDEDPSSQKDGAIRLPSKGRRPLPWPAPGKTGFVGIFKQQGRLRYLGWTPDSRFFAYTATFDVDCSLYAKKETGDGDEREEREERDRRRKGRGKEVLEGSFEIQMAVVLDVKERTSKTFFLSSRASSAEARRTPSSGRSKRAGPSKSCERHFRAFVKEAKAALYPAQAWTRWRGKKRFRLQGSALSPRGGLVAKASSWPKQIAPGGRPPSRSQPLRRKKAVWEKQTYLISMRLLQEENVFSSGISFFFLEKGPLRPARRLTSFWSPNGRACLWILAEGFAKTTEGTQDEIRHTFFLALPSQRPLPLLRLAPSSRMAPKDLDRVGEMALSAQKTGFSIEFLSNPDRIRSHLLQAHPSDRLLVDQLQPLLPHKTRIRLDSPSSKKLLLLLGSLARYPRSSASLPSVPWLGPWVGRPEGMRAEGD